MNLGYLQAHFKLDASVSWDIVRFSKEHISAVNTSSRESVIKDDMHMQLSYAERYKVIID